MKRIAYYLSVLALAVFTFTSCEDVPSPFGQIVAPKSDDVVVIEPSGKGTLDSPYNVAGVIEYLGGLGADVPSPNDVYIKGFITSITETFGTQYGNATFEISDTKDAPNKFLCYRVKYFGGQGYSDPTALNIKEGDEVIICGKVVNYKGNTPETSANAAYVYSINGTGGGTTPPPASEVKKVTVDEFIKAAESATQWYELTGTVKNLKDGDKYGNFDIEDATGSVYVYGLLSEKGGEKQKFAELAAAKGIKNGSKLTLHGLRSSYNNAVQVKDAYFVSVESGSGGGSGDAKGSGTLADPYNAAGANAYISSLAADTESSNDIYIKGKLVKYANNGEFNTQYGNASFYLSDDGSESGDQFYVFRTLYLGNVKYESGETPKAGDDIIICGKVVNYKGNTPETAANKSYIYSMNGKTSAGGGGTTGGDGTVNKPFNIAEAIAKCQQIGETASTEKYYVKGIVVTGGTASGGYGNVTFKMGDTKDATDVFTAYQVAGSDGEKLADGYEVPVGAEVIVYGPLLNYKGNTPETAGKSAAQIVTINGKKTNDTGGGGTAGGDEITAAFGDLDCSNIAAIKLSDGTTISVAQEDGKSAPIYHESTKIIRIYARNSLSIDAGSKKITKVVFAYDTYNGTAYKGNDEMYAEAGGSKITPTKDDANVTFSGVNNSKVKVVNWLESGNSGGTQFRITGVTITYAK
jgi:hypothetical protein